MYMRRLIFETNWKFHKNKTVEKWYLKKQIENKKAKKNSLLNIKLRKFWQLETQAVFLKTNNIVIVHISNIDI